MTVVKTRRYDVVIESGSLRSLGERAMAVAHAHRYAIISDSNVGPLYGTLALASFPARRASLFTVMSGEKHKLRDSWASLTDQLSANKYGRDTIIIALGGGMVGDLAGFVAATYMRGVLIIQVPTTLLAMVDAALGGKTGVDTPAGKNFVGAFHPPTLVLEDPQVLATLPVTELRGGLAEVLKHGIVADRDYFEETAENLPALLDGSAGDSLTRLIVRSVEIKTEIVDRDEREDGVRKILNFGHTIGHGLEAASDYSLSHGEAVAIGMCLEAEAAERAGIAESGTAGAIRSAVKRSGLPVEKPSELDGAKVMELARSDKKTRSGEIEYAVPIRIGQMAGETDGWTVRIPDELMKEVLG